MSNTANTSEPTETGSPWLKSVAITGFQGDRSIGISLNRSVNFLIGRNGCGKTTLINLINDAITGDSVSLLRSRFDTISLSFARSATQRKVFSVKYKKQPDVNRGADLVDLEVIDSRSRVLERRSIREVDIVPQSLIALGRNYEKPTNHLAQALKAAGFSMPISTWLNVHRGEYRASVYGADVIQNPIDRKIDELVNRAARYLSALDSRASSLSAEFQKEYYLSIVERHGGPNIIRLYSSARKLNLPQERDMLDRILLHLKLKPDEYKERVDHLFASAASILSNGSEDRYMLEDVLTIIDITRIHSLNEKWAKFESQRKEIYEPKRRFIDIVNSHFVDKVLDYNDRNQPTFKLKTGGVVKHSELSSGEKQAFLILSEALVQETRPAIYLADEPELSLHVDWQQFLVENIRSLNPNCQVIFATHSPDILGRFGDLAIDLESI